MSEMTMARRSVDLIAEDLERDYGNRTGYVCIGSKDRNHPDPKHFDQEFFMWPMEQEFALMYIRDMVAAGRCVWKPTSLFPGMSRGKGQSLPSNVLSFEMDRVTENARERLNQLGADLINSGRPGHLHVKVYLDRDLSGEEICAWSEHLARACDVSGAADSGGKWNDNELLRIVGTRNTKPGVDAEVTWKKAGRSHTRPYPLDRLAQMLGPAPVSGPGDAPARNDARSAQIAAVRPGKASLTDDIRATMRERDPGDGTERFKRSMRLIKECQEAGMDQAETLWVLERHEPSMSKFQYTDRLWAEITRVWGKSTRKDLTHGDEFWDARPALSHIRDFARARMISPWSLLGVVLARTVAVIPTEVVLPPTVGSYASLNFAVALVGKSGAGKGGSMAAAGEAFDFGLDIHTATIGSGEGIAKQYAYRNKNEVVTVRDSVLFSVDEVDTLKAITERAGSTLLSELRKGWAGERLGFSNSDPTRTIPLMRHRYRLSVVVSVQPENAGVLLDDRAGGTPQRFVWLPVTDPGAPDDVPPCPDPIRRPVDIDPTKDVVVDLPRPNDELRPLIIPASAEHQIREARRAALRGEGGDDLDSHTLLARLKVAVPLMWLDGRSGEITEEDWHLSGLLMEVSDHTRREMQQELARVERKRGTQRAKASGRNAAVAEVAQVNTRVRLLANNMVRKLKDAEGSLTQNQLKKGVNRKLAQDHWDEAVELLESEGRIKHVQLKQGGVRYTLL
ncbi:hypothetical protein [Nocardia gipuzkoensis]